MAKKSINTSSKIPAYNDWFKIIKNKEDIGYLTQVKFISNKRLVAYYVDLDYLPRGWYNITLDKSTSIKQISPEVKLCNVVVPEVLSCLKKSL